MFYRFPTLVCISNVMENLLFLSSENWCHCLGLDVAFQCLRRKAARNSCLQMINIFCVSSKTSIPDLYICMNYLMCLSVFLKIDYWLKCYRGETGMKQSRLTWQRKKKIHPFVSFFHLTNNYCIT